MTRKFLLCNLVITCLALAACEHDAFRFRIAFPESPSLKEGAEVRYLGMKVGSVGKISLANSASNTPEVLVDVSLEEKGFQIRRDDKFSISTAGFLGDSFVNIVPGPPTAQPISIGSTVQGEVPTLAPKSIAGLLAGLGITAKLESLPPEKRQELIKKFDDMIDAEVAGTRGASGSQSKSSGSKK